MYMYVIPSNVTIVPVLVLVLTFAHLEHILRRQSETSEKTIIYNIIFDFLFRTFSIFIEPLFFFGEGGGLVVTLEGKGG